MNDEQLLDLVRQDRGDVYKAGVLVAELARLDDRVEFRYLLDHVDGPSVATTLPAGPDVVAIAGRAVPTYFAGLLPEGRRLTALRSALKTSADDEVAVVLGPRDETSGFVEGAVTDPGELRLEASRSKFFDVDDGQALAKWCHDSAVASSRNGTAYSSAYAMSFLRGPGAAKSQSMIPTGSSPS